MTIRGWAMALLSVGLSTGLAHAESPQQAVELRWYAPAECPDNLALVRAIEDFLGQPVSDAPRQQLSIVARVLGDVAHGYAAKVTFVNADATTERILDHSDCSKLTEGVALLAALAIDPERVQQRQQAAPAQEPEAATATALPATPVPVEPAVAQAVLSDRQAMPEAKGRAARRRQLRVGLLGLVGGGMLPSAAPGLSAEVSLALGVFEAAIGGRYWTTRSAQVPGYPGSSVELSLVTAGLRLCGVPGGPRWSWLICARSDVGDMSGHGEQVDNARTRHAVVTGLGGTLAVAFASGRLRPLAGTDLLWLASRPRFGVLQEGRPIQAFRPQNWQVTGFLGLSYEL